MNERSDGKIGYLGREWSGNKSASATDAQVYSYPIIKLKPEVKLTPGANGTYTLYVEK